MNHWQQVAPVPSPTLPTNDLAYVIKRRFSCGAMAFAGDLSWVTRVGCQLDEMPNPVGREQLGSLRQTSSLSKTRSLRQNIDLI